MTNTQFAAMAQLMKRNKMGVDDLTNKLNWWMGEVHIQEMTNYLLKTEPMPDEVEKALIEMFGLDEVETPPLAKIAPNQMSVSDFGVGL